MESFMTSIGHVIENWHTIDENGSVDKAQAINRLLEDMACFAKDIFMPDLSSMLLAVCAYAKHEGDPGKLNEMLITLNHLNDLTRLIYTNQEAIGILEAAYDRNTHSTPTVKEEKYELV